MIPVRHQSRAYFLPEFRKELAKSHILFGIVIGYLALAEVLAWKLGEIDHLILVLRTSRWIVWAIAWGVLQILLVGV